GPDGDGKCHTPDPGGNAERSSLQLAGPWIAADKLELDRRPSRTAAVVDPGHFVGRRGSGHPSAQRDPAGSGSASERTLVKDPRVVGCITAASPRELDRAANHSPVEP